MSSLKNKKILVVNDHGPSYATPFAFLGLEVVHNPDILENNPQDIALVIFTGGADVSPDLYGETAHPTTSNSTVRDMEELEVYNLASSLGIPMSGICRGAQFLCTMAGGSVIQDVNNHCRDHDINVLCPTSGVVRCVNVTSSHHQMQYPFALPTDNYQVLGWGVEARSTHYAINKEETVLAKDASEMMRSEPDIVFYPMIKALAVQYHPEWMEKSSDGFILFQSLVAKYLVPLMKERYDDDGVRQEITQTAG